MRAMVLNEFGGEFQLEQRPQPVPGPGEAVVEVIACGLGMTLEHARNGLLGGDAPRVLGHEFSGHVAAVGPGVERWSPGDAVVASCYLTCGSCFRCAEGRESLCVDNGGHVGAASDGAFAEYIAIPARNLVAIPAGVELGPAGLNADAMATPVHVCGPRAEIVPGQRVAVIGAGGGVGVHVLQMARISGAAAIAVERDPAKLAELERSGLADLCLDSSRPGWVAELRDLAGGRLDAVVDLVCTEDTLAGGVEALGVGGTLAIVGFDVEADVVASSSRILQEELRVVGSRYVSRAEIARGLELTAQGRFAPVVGARYPLEGLNDAFEAMRANQVFGRILIEIGGTG